MAALFAYYDWATELPWLEAHHLNLAALAKLRCVPEYFVVDRPGRKTRCTRIARFTREALDDCTLLGLFNFDSGDVDLHHPRACSVFMRDAPGRAMYIYDKHGNIRGIDDWLPVVRPVVENLPGGVGLAIELPDTNSPEAFVVGADLRPRDESEYQSNKNWRMWRRDNAGSAVVKLRDIYRVNVLPQQFLDSAIGGRSLESWISQDTRRGDLRPFGNGAFLWTIGEANLSMIRSELRLGGKLF